MDLRIFCGGRAGRPARRFLVALLTLFLMSSVGIRYGYGQSSPGSITGTVVDATDAVIPGATVVLRNEGTGSEQRTSSNAAGFFAFTAVTSGTYMVTIQSTGFTSLQRTGIVISPGDRINVPNLILKVGAVTEQVTVEATPDVVIPVDSGEKSFVISNKEIQNLSIIGRSADELLKILPGVVYTNPDRPGEPAGLVVQFNKGIGDYNVSGTRNTQIANVSDGADVIDPGCNCGSAVTPNVDMIQEVKITTANFTAATARGPIIFNAVSKAGTSEFHGMAYTYFRSHQLNSRDWRNNFFNSEKPTDSFYFPGFNIGGPIKKDKIFFFAALEIQRQKVDLGIRPATVPTAEMRAGDFTDTAYINALNGADVNLVPTNDAEGNNNWDGGPIDATMVSGGIVDPSAFDPGGEILLNLYPLPNRDPRTAGGFNYISNVINPQHRHQKLVRLDYNVSDNTRIYTRFNHEYQRSPSPYTLWWNNTNDVPTPGELEGSYNTYSSSTSIVNVLSPTSTNEVVVALTYWSMPHKFKNPDQITTSGLGYPYQGLFRDDPDRIVPSVTDWGGGVADMVQPGGLIDPTIFGNKWLVSVSDNFSKVVGTHTMKFGVYADLITNTEPSTFNNNGLLEPTNWGGNSTRNAWADLLMGRLGNFTETGKNTIALLRKREWAGYVQDSWKATRRLTLDMGLRFQHIGRIYDAEGKLFGFDPNLYDPNAPIGDYTGLVANYLGDDVSKSVEGSPAVLWAPRFGFAYDLTGKGNTVIRGGGGVYYYHGRHAQVLGSMGNPPNLSSVSIPITTLAEIELIDPNSATPPKVDLTVLEIGDKGIPTTYNWVFTLSHRLPGATVLEASYVANASVHQKTCNNCSDNNLNKVPEGAMFGFPLGGDADAYRPYQSYGAIGMESHALNQNYNSLQVTVKRQTGRVNYNMAYTWSKALGVGGSSFGTAVDGFDRRGRSYGPLPYDRTHILSVAYNINLPDATQSRSMGYLMNGWQLSGITQFSSGQPLVVGRADVNGINMSGTMAVSAFNSDGDLIPDISDIAVNGTPDTPARPILICNPAEGLADGQLANPACFVAPFPGTNGSYQLPYMRHPGFQNHDVSLFKNFPLKREGQRFQFRFSMFNFVNHPLPFFEGTDPGLELIMEDGTPSSGTLSEFGRTTFKRGRRLMQFALKFYF